MLSHVLVSDHCAFCPPSQSSPTSCRGQFFLLLSDFTRFSKVSTGNVFTFFRRLSLSQFLKENSMLKRTYFCLNLFIQQINSVKFFFKLKSNYIEKLNIETKNSLKKGLIPWSLKRLSTVWYDVGYNTLSLNMAVCFEILMLFRRSMSYEVFVFLQQLKDAQ